LTSRKMHKTMPKHDADLSMVDSPEAVSGVQPEESTQPEAQIDPAAELRAPTAEESAEPASEQEPAPAEPEQETVSRTEFDRLKAERDQLLDRLARLQAEFENARKRTERERVEFRDYATGNVVERFLPVLDHFELALKANGSVEQLRSGVELIVKQMAEVLRQLQVTPVPAVGEPFDPRVHEAIGTVEREDLADQHVAEEIRRGYRLRERLLRPAMVQVAHNPNQKSE
jgi:molecular chaperone GrpE